MKPIYATFTLSPVDWMYNPIVSETFRYLFDVDPKYIKGTEKNKVRICFLLKNKSH